MPRYFEDLEVGTVRDLGEETVTREGLLAFGERWDPLVQHVDAEAARASLTDGLVASGLHTVCLSNRLAVEGFRQELAGVVGLGFDDLRFPAPVRPGDTVAFRHEVTGVRPSASDPGVGVVEARITGETAEEGLVLEYSINTLVKRRETTGGEEGGDAQDVTDAGR